jgi:hypothetical protein
VHLLEQPAFQHAGRVTVVDEVGQPIGVVSVTDIQRTIRSVRPVSTIQLTVLAGWHRTAEETPAQPVQNQEEPT